MQTRNSPYNKTYNRRFILRSLFAEKLSRAELSRKTGLTKAAISIIVDALIREGLIQESGADTANTGVGRTPTKLEIVPDRYYIIGVDIARDGCSIGLVDFGGNVLMADEVVIHQADTPESAVVLISEAIKERILSKNIDESKVLGLGITTPGPVDTKNGIIDDIPEFSLWCRFAVVDEFKKHFGMRVRLERDANAIALAELFFGAGTKFDSFMCIMTYIDIGFGIIKKRGLYQGNLGLTPELGHVSVNFNGDPCICGNRGCLYHYFGYSNIIQSVQKVHPGVNSWKEIVDRANGGEAYFVKIIDHYAQILSVAVVNAINLFQLDKIVLSGFVIYRPDMFVSALKKYVENSYMARHFFKVEIYTTEMVHHENLVGAATGIIENFLKIND